MSNQNRRREAQQKAPRGSSAGRENPGGEEKLARRAAQQTECVFETLLGWKVYPDRVVLIAVDGRKHEIPVLELINIHLEEA